MMNKIIVTIARVVITMLIFIVPLGIAGTIETHYSLDGVVTSVEDDEVTVKAKTNGEWVFYGEGYEEGQKVKLKMFTNYTDNDIYDDEVVGAKVVK